MKLLRKILSVFLSVWMVVGYSITTRAINRQKDITSSIKVSVIIPVYNVAPWLRECMDSLVNQTLKDIEFICIDDCSTDNSLDILKEYASADTRVKIIEQKENQGAYVARNAGLKVATGEYIGFVDPDDYIELDTYEISYHTAKQDNADILVFGGETFPIKHDRLNSMIDSRDIKYNGISLHNYLVEKGSQPFVWNKIYKRVYLEEKKFRFHTLRYGADTLLGFQLFPDAKKITFISNKFYHYRINRKGCAGWTFWSNIINNTERKLELLQLSMELVKNSVYFKDNEAIWLKYAIDRTYSDITHKNMDNSNRRKYAKRLFEILKEKNIYNEKNIKELENSYQKKYRILLKLCKEM